MEKIENLNSFFKETFKNLTCEYETRAYIINLFASFKKENDLSNQSITLIYNKARTKYSFELYQKLGDWILFTKTLYPKHFNGATADYYSYIAKISYDACFRIVNKEWKCFKDLSNNFDYLILQLSNNSFILNKI